MCTSSLAGHFGKYDVLDESKLDQIRDIIMSMYQPKDGGLFGPNVARQLVKSARPCAARTPLNYYALAVRLCYLLLVLLCYLVLLYYSSRSPVIFVEDPRTNKVGEHHFRRWDCVTSFQSGCLL